MFDTGSDINIVSKSFVIRNDLSGSVISLEEPRPVMGLGGLQTIVHELMNIKWQFRTDSPMRDVHCYVIDVDQNDFDILLGGKFLREHKLLVVQEPGGYGLLMPMNTIPTVRMAGCGLMPDMKNGDHIREMERARKRRALEDAKQAKKRPGQGPPPEYSIKARDLGIRDFEFDVPARPVGQQQVAQHHAQIYAHRDGRVVEHEDDSIQAHHYPHSRQQKNVVSLSVSPSDMRPAPPKRTWTLSSMMGKADKSAPRSEKHDISLLSMATPGTTYSGTTYPGDSPNPSLHPFGPLKRKPTIKERVDAKWRKVISIVLVSNHEL
jgi:hypothetical protein